MIEIMNLRNTRPTQLYDFRIDRASVLGNPYVMSRGEIQRDKVCNLYEKHFVLLVENKDSMVYAKMHEILDAYRQHGRVRLFCWCAPKRCHGETIKRWLRENKL